MVDRTYIRPDKGGTVLVGTGHPKENEPAEPDSYVKEADEEFVRETSSLLAHRFPAMAGGGVVHGWAGLYTITPDWNMILDRSPANDNHYLAVGGSGHSFKIAPAMGLCPRRDDRGRRLQNRRHLTSPGWAIRRRQRAALHLRRQQGLRHWRNT